MTSLQFVTPGLVLVEKLIFSPKLIYASVVLAWRSWLRPGLQSAGTFWNLISSKECGSCVVVDTVYKAARH